MKKIFAVSFLSVFAVVGVARASYNGYYASGLTDVDQNYNLASVNYVQGSYDAAVDIAKALVVKSDKKTNLAGGTTFGGYAGSDYAAPTIKYMEDSIAEVVAGIDTSGLVAKDDVVVDTYAGTMYLLEKGQAMEGGDEAAKTELQSKVLGGDMAYGIVKGLNTMFSKDNIVTKDEDAAAAAEMAAGTNDAKYDTVVPSYRTVYGAVHLLETEMDTGLDSKVDIAQGEANKNAIMITNSAGNVIPAPVGDCANTTNKCALVTGVDTSGNLVLQWEVIARNVPQPSAEE